MADDVAAQAADRQRRALLSAGKISNLKSEVTGFRDAAGAPNYPKGWQMTHDRRGDEGRFVGTASGNFGLSVTEIKDAILSDAMRDLEAVAHEFRRGVLTGDLRTQAKSLAKVSGSARLAQARLSEVTKVMRGEKTTDATAQALAEAMMAVAEKLRLRFNEAGGTIGKLDGWGGPQSHNQDAVLRFGRDAWVRYVMPLLDRDRMVNQLTGRKLSDAELVESLQVVWERITTDGWIDEEKISGVPTGRGALWKQHADHRFLHFKSADAWTQYAREFGNSNPWVSYVNWVQVMARDIAAMEKFGPNPNATRTYMKQWIIAQAQKVAPTAQIILEQRTRLQQLSNQLEVANPEYEALARELDAVLSEIETASRHPAWSRRGFLTTVTGQRATAAEMMAQWQQRLDGLHQRRIEIDEKMRSTPQTMDNLAAQQAFTKILEEMRDPIRFAETTNPVGYANNLLKFTDAIWEFQRGALGTPINSQTANVMATGRNVITSTLLGSAILSAMSDTTFQALRRGFVGMAASKSNLITTFVDTIRTIGPENRREAVRAGLILDSAINAWQAEAAYATRWAKARSVTGFVADRVIALQGLNAWTQAGKHAFGLELMGHLADEAAKGWRDLTPGVRDMLERAGFDSAAWDKIRRAQLHEGALLRPNEIADIDASLAQRYIAMILRETRYAIIEPTATAKAIMLGSTRPGTVAGELVRGAGQLKTFPITVVMMHMGQIASQLAGGDRAGSVRYTGALLVTGAIMGAFAMALKDINSGRDPRKLLDEATYADLNFWGAAILQAGGLGIYGDFLFSNVNRHGGAWADTLAGPMIPRIENLWNLTGGNAIDLANNAIRSAQGQPTKPTRFGRELTRFFQQNTPTVVWNKLLIERMVWNQMQQLVDPEAQTAFNRQISTRKRDYKQDFWWSPGKTAPDRAPDLTRTFATR